MKKNTVFGFITEFCILFCKKSFVEGKRDSRLELSLNR